MCEDSVRKDSLVIPEVKQIINQSEVGGILNYKEPLKIAQNMERRIERSVLQNSGDCVSVALMGTGSTTVHVQRMRVRSTEISLSLPTTTNGYEIYSPSSNACLRHEGHNIFIIQENPANLFFSHNICDTDRTNMKPKHTMKSHVLNPEAKEFIPYNFREPKETNCKLLSIDVNEPISNISENPVEHINVGSQNFKVEISSCTTLIHDQAPLLTESTSCDDKSENTCTCLVDDEQTKTSDDEEILMALTECLSLCQSPENESKVITSDSIDSESSEIISDTVNSEPLVSPCRVKEDECIAVEDVCSKSEGCRDCNSEEPDFISNINKQSKCQNLESSCLNMNFVESDEETEVSDEESSDESDEENEEGINESDDDDDVTICFTLEGSQASDNESDDQDYDDDDFETDEDDDDDLNNDYDGDLFQVEFNEEVKVPVNCLSQIITDFLSENDNSHSSDGVDGVDSSYLEERKKILQVNKQWNEAIDLNWCQSTPAKVTFSDDVEIYSADDFCRKSPWETCALDRMRFRSRIEETEGILSPILSPEHRCKVLSRLQAMEKM